MIKTSQKELVLAYLNNNEWITPQDAWEHLGITRLASVIFLLQKDGVPIQKTWRESVNRYGKKTIYRAYKIDRSVVVNG